LFLFISGCGGGGDVAPLPRLVEAAHSLDAIPINVAGHVRRLDRARAAMEAGDTLAAQSLLAAELAYVDTCIETGLLNPEEGAAFRDAVSYVRTRASGSDVVSLGDPNMAETAFIRAIHKIVAEGNPEAVTAELALCSANGCDDGVLRMMGMDVKLLVMASLSVIPKAGTLLSGLTTILWPSSTETYLRCTIEELIDEAISKNIQEQVQNTLKGLNNVLKDYQKAVDPKKGSPPTYMSEKFNVAKGAFLLSEPHFQSKGYEILLLPEFAQMANLHLALLRDGILFGASWGWSQADVDDLKAEMAEKIKAYTDYAKKWYQSAYDAAPWWSEPRQDSKVREFNGKNQVARDLTIRLLDFVETWPYLNPVNYPDPVKVTLTREIFSDARGTTNGSIPYYGLEIDRTPKAPITGITIWSWGVNLPIHYEDETAIEAIQVSYGGIAGPRMGAPEWSGSPKKKRDVSISAPFTVAYGLSGDIVHAVGFKNGSGQDSGIHGGKKGRYWSYSYEGEVISSIKVMGFSTYYYVADCIVFGFRFPGSYRHTVPVTVQNKDRLPLANVPVVLSAGMDQRTNPPTPTDVIATQRTDGSGRTTFNIPLPTSTGNVCFSSQVTNPAGASFKWACSSLPGLPVTVSLGHDLPLATTATVMLNNATVAQSPVVASASVPTAGYGYGVPWPPQDVKGLSPRGRP
jgi:hypothetical protein